MALLQIASEEHCFLFRLNLTGLTLPLILLLENPNVLKVGLSLKDDFMMLRKRAPFEPRGYIELQEYVRMFGIEDKSLQKIYGILFGQKISKSQRLSNWEAAELTQPYIELQEYVRMFGIEDKSLQKIYGILFGQKISKSQRLSNWEAAELTQPQQLYAATDAWACLNIYNKLQQLKNSGDFEIADN